MIRALYQIFFKAIFIFSLASVFYSPSIGQNLSLLDLIHIERADFVKVRNLMENKGFNHLDTEDKFGCTSILWAYRDSMDCATDPPLLEKAICDSNVSSVHYYVRNNPSQLQEDAEALDMNLITTIEINETSTGYKYQNQSYRLLYIFTKEADGKEGCEVKLTKR